VSYYRPPGIANVKQITNMTKTCFYCGGPATGVDHVPPRCFFPKDKDLPVGVADMRKNLITVPACNDHNGKYSTDDEIASLVVRLPYQANVLGQHDFCEKGLRAIEKRKGLVPSLFQKIEVMQFADGRELPTMQFDATRVNRVMERIARGLFFHEFRRCWDYDLSIVSDGPLMPNLSSNPAQPAIRMLNREFQHAHRNGDNPSVFWYEWTVDIGGDYQRMLRMCFYEGLRYLVIPKKAA
jgi:hypothetical protein